MGLYPQPKRAKGKATSVLKANRTANKPVDVKRSLPGNIIVIHGVNDVGTSFDAVELGLCKGLEERLHRTFKPASYRMPEAADKEKLEPDPDAVFFKRSVDENTDSPVIPFYWGYRELDNKVRIQRGQFVDRYGNRLDKDKSKGGGPFANATSNLPDMWNKGFGTVPMDVGGDPVRPLLNCPGRLYMVLAASRLAALISMIRDYDEGDTVTVVAHSQGCLVTLLAQAMLSEKGLRPADTLILTHPPYSLVDTFSYVSKGSSHLTGGSDTVMERHYANLGGMQCLHARLQTLANIVSYVTGRKPTPSEPEFNTLTDHKQHDGAVGSQWNAGSDRDNRGKVYLYFCPQDMTVALDNMQGIGWQGVPEYITGTQWVATPGKDEKSERSLKAQDVTLNPLEKLGKRFFQRVFTNKLRTSPANQTPAAVLVGARPPYDYALRVKGEDDHGHVDSSGRKLRANFPVATWPIDPHDKPQDQRNGIRTITGEELRKPVAAVLSNAKEITPPNRGPCEEVDPIDAAIAITSEGGRRTWFEDHPDKSAGGSAAMGSGMSTTARMMPPDERRKLTEQYNKARNWEGDDQRSILAAAYKDGKLKIQVQESPNEARKRWQHEVSAKSFHGSIIGNKENHQHVTAYDVAIGQGKASTDPMFYAYLCDVADWRLKKLRNGEMLRPGILSWEKFITKHSSYWSIEPSWRKDLIAGNSSYYSSGTLPDLPLPDGGPLWEIVIAESVTGNRVLPKNEARS
ncbi:DUF3274 domain-containing protein [Pseudoduganella ginsengisoli]|uniref:DUF3274 domain-containing protein n=1 Tax=Pseudoduganella ginsengisoli TaxID=1462440 RepID=A0A6L6PU63_9BURK|nr:DUF3274 domain-containing protein [Pseudoduganella ginsengisoli]MTW01007.1 DUF3274 domain-containing protein [Pseudoduganella ginsengisoli]